MKYMYELLLFYFSTRANDDDDDDGDDDDGGDGDGDDDDDDDDIMTIVSVEQRPGWGVFKWIGIKLNCTSNNNSSSFLKLV